MRRALIVGGANGIGLTIVSRILVLCGGTVRVDSSPGGGSTFTVTLPVTVRDEAEPAENKGGNP